MSFFKSMREKSLTIYTVLYNTVTKQFFNVLRSRVYLSLFLRISLIGFCCFLFLVFYFLGIFQALFLKIGLALGGRARAGALLFLGLPGGLALAIGCYFSKVLITEDGVSLFLQDPFCMMPAGSDSGGNADSGSWKKYLNLSSDSEGQGKGQENCEILPAESQKRDRSTDPKEDVGPSSVRQRVDSTSAPGAGDIGGPSQQAPSSDQISSEILESRLLELEPDQLAQWVTSTQFNIEEQINKLRRQEGMRQLGPLRGEQIILYFEEKYGTPSLEKICRDLKEKGLSSTFYKESKMEHNLPTEKELKKMDRDVTR